MNVAELGEFELIARLTAGLHTAADHEVGVGDDCAILDLGSEDLLLATCDSQVEDVHFTLQTSTPEAIGQKALAINLSDIAAMGGTPRAALVSLFLPATLPVAVLDGIYAGLRAQAQRFETAIVGGNISGAGAAGKLVIDITLLGTVKRGHALLRSGAQAGDLLCVTGWLGDSAAGLQSFLQACPHIESHDLHWVRQRHTTPTPRIQAGQVLSECGPELVTALLDISDGLSGDLQHLCERSGCGARIELAALPLSTPLKVVANALQQDPVRLALHGGEDYELLLTLRPQALDTVRTALAARANTPLTVIGAMQPAASGIQVVYPDGHLEALQAQSWDHLKPSRP